MNKNYKYKYLLKVGKITGIYRIKNTVTGRSYIGKSIDIGNRFKSHLNNLKRGKHHCSSLQEAWTADTSTSFIFQIVEELSTDTTAEALSEREVYWWLQEVQPYNGKPKKSGYPGPTPETKAKVSEALKGSKNHNWRGGIRSDPEYIKEYAKEYRKSNKDKILEYEKQYREANKDKILEYEKQYRAVNRDKAKEYAKERYEANRDKILEYQKQYREAHKEKHREYMKQYHQKKKT